MARTLPSRMEEVLLLVGGLGLREAEVARRLGVTRQSTGRTLREARARLTEMFLELAETLGADVIRINVNKGFMVARSRQLGAKLYAFYVPGRGVRVMFEGSLDCRGRDRELCRDLVYAAERWGLIEPGGDLQEDARRALEAMEA